jgi:UDP-N-acetylglucosamine transferase subunit ALG13
MIFVTVGTNEARFDRLLRAVHQLELDERVFVQYGHSGPLRRVGTDLVDFLAFEAMGETIRRARAVVTHAGVGSVLVCLSNGKRPIVVPRRRAYGEAVDDHQLQLGRRFAEAGLVTLVEDPAHLGAALAADQQAAAILPSASALSADLTAYLTSAIHSPPVHA